MLTERGDEQTMGDFKQNDENVNKAKKVKRKTVRNTKPDGFLDIEKMAKDLLNAKGINYYEWLHERHEKVVLEEVTRKKDRIVDLFL